MRKLREMQLEKEKLRYSLILNQIINGESENVVKTAQPKKINKKTKKSSQYFLQPNTDYASNVTAENY